MATILFFGALAFAILFLWYLGSPHDVSRRRIGLALWMVCVVTCLLSIYPPEKNVRLGLDLKGGTSYLIELQGAPSEAALEQAVEVIRKRVDKFGVAEPMIQPSGANRIIVQIPGLSEADKQTTRGQLEKVAKLEFRLVHPNNDAEIRIVESGGPVPLGYELLEETEVKEGKTLTNKLLVSRRVSMDGKSVASAFRTIDQMGQAGVSLEFKSEGREQFGKLTEANVGRRLAIVLDGQVKSAPNIRTSIYGGQAEISGNFSQEEAEELASVLENPLDTPVQIIEERGVDPSLGKDSIRSGLMAGAIGSLAVVIFTLFYYRYIGLIAVVGLLVNLVILFGLLAQFHFTLTLPGIAGIILTVGMAVDANVLIYERIREELADGKPVEAAIEGGFDKAFSSILDANVTTIITSVILFWKGSGAVQGFAITLTLGILGTLFASLIVTRNLFDWSLASGKLKSVSMASFIKKANFNILKNRNIAFWASICLVAIGLASFVSKGDKAYSVDFTGGEALTLHFTEKQDSSRMRDALTAAGVADASLQYQKTPDGSEESLFVRTKFGQGDLAEQTLKSTFAQAEFRKVSLDKVGPLVGEQLKTESWIALLLGIAGVLVYVTWRFEFSFALGAIVALLHDVLITVGAFALLGHEISLTVIGAILAIAGYSINDSIVIFDRVRENLKNNEKGSLEQVINHALNQTLSRTLLTAGTTILSVAALYFFGGPVIQDFALALLIGITAGTYSSLFIAAPIVLWFTGGRDEWLRRQVVRNSSTTAASA